MSEPDAGENAAGRVVRVARCDLQVRPEAWPLAAAHRAAITANWAERSRANPAIFNGRVFVTRDYALEADRFSGWCSATDFASFIYWRAERARDPEARDLFGVALIFSSDGGLVLGRQGPGHLNAGLTYPPGGFIDERDVLPDGRIDIDAGIAREIAEETGLDPAHLARLPGYVLTLWGPHVAVGIAYRSALAAADLAAEIGRRMADGSDDELDRVVVPRRLADLEGVPLTGYFRFLAPHLLPP